MIAKASGVALLLGSATLVLARDTSPVKVRLESWWNDNRAASALREDWAEVANVPTTLGHGPPQVVQFVSYDCGYCSQAHDTIAAFRQGHPQLTIAIRYFPSRKYPSTRRAAAAAICSETQGRFEAMHNLLLRSANRLESVDLSEIASEAGVPDLQAWGDCIHSEGTGDRIRSDSVLASRFLLRGTPVMLSADGERLFGTMTVRGLDHWLRVHGDSGTES
jgi:protein-disulfide isomerase